VNSPTPGVPLELGPMMRVGLYNSTSPFTVTADSPFEVRSGSGELLVSLPARSPVTVSYDPSASQYAVSSLGLSRTQSDYVVIKALDVNTIMEIMSLSRPLPWNPAVNENTFRGSIEIHHSATTGKTWAINILPMEHYLRGIAETSSESPVEFLKVMSIAARTYATYHFQRQTKHADEHFFVDSEFDQVYKGYSLEKRHPSLTEAVQATTGQVVTYTDPSTNETKIAITPYYTRSDGRTRSWSEVWGGDVPWAKSVSVPHDQGKTLLGHGVGMSARGALLMIVEDGKTYEDVLKYFFTGIQIEDRY
jgi:peptidoglycan hydrolase-like amidase